MKKLIFFEYITYLSIVSLILIITIWNAFLYPSENLPRIIPTIIYNLPLLIIMFKLKKNKFSTYIITSYVMLFYFVVGVGNTTTDNTFLLGMILSIVSLIAFICAILYVREKNRISAENRS